jgi:peptidoglycan/LPS O-acetylase OafA/YrhL
MGSRPSPVPRLPALDGVRALAIGGVLAAHAGVPGLAGGFLGVDLFFVLSGFLITSLLYREWTRTGALDLWAFWARRARRLVPAALLMIVVVVAAGSLFRPDAAGQLRSAATSAVLWAGNWRWALDGTDYFAQGGVASPLQHTWSLGVEEQFYLLWPLLLVGLWRVGRAWPRRWLLGAALLLAVASVAATTWLSAAAPLGRVYFGTDTRAQELCIGAALAAALAPTWRWSERRQRARRSPQPVARHPIPLLLSVVGLGGLLVLGHRATGTATQFHAGLMSVCSLLGAALIAGMVLDRGQLVARAFATPPMRYLGRISYGTYLWHWPLFQVLDGERTHLGPSSLAVLRVAVALAAGAASTALVEMPLRRPLWSSRRVLQSAGVAAAGALTFVACSAPGNSSLRTSPPTSGLDAPPALSSPRSTASPPAPASGSRDAHRGAQRVDVFGDSIGWTLVHYLPATPGFRFADRTQLGCGVVQGGPYRYFGQQYGDRPRCDRWPAEWRTRVRADRPDVVLLVVGRWETMDRVHDGTWTHVGVPAFDRYLGATLGRAIDVLGSTGAEVVVADEPYNRRGEQPNGELYPEDQPARVDAWNRIVRSVVGAHRGAVLLPLNHKLCPDGRFTWTVAGRQVRSDGVHLTPQGVAWLTPWLLGHLRHG